MAWVKVERAEKKVEPFSVDFAYTGTVQEYVVPITGLYKIEARGSYGYAQYESRRGIGGYACGYKKLTKGTKLYICCGGIPYNGGATTAKSGRSTNGGGATHIALEGAGANTLVNIGKDLFDEYGLIVAGGGGSGAFLSGGKAGDGGGTNTNGIFGKGSEGGGFEWENTDGSYSYHPQGSGGGGYYGGKGASGSGAQAGYGGSSWVNNLPSLTYKNVDYNSIMTAGANKGLGSATISFITK